MKSPGDGAKLAQLVFSCAAAMGLGLVDAALAVFLIEGLRKLGASSLVAWTSLAGGAAVAVLLAPLAAALAATDLKARKRVTYTLLTLAFLAIFGIAGLFMITSDPDFEPRVYVTRIAVIVALSVVYRSAVQAAPFVPLCMDAALVQGEADKFPARRDIALGGFYVLHRAGILTANIAIASIPKSIIAAQVWRLLFVFAGAASFLLLISVLVFPRDHRVQEIQSEKDGIPAEDAPVRALSTIAGLYMDPDEVETKEAPAEKAQTRGGAATSTTHSPLKKAFSDIGEVFSAPHVKFLLLECFCYTIGFGQLASVMAPFFNEVIFQLPPGGNLGFTWASYAALLGWGVGVFHDGLLPIFLFGKTPRTRGTRYIWTLGLLLGAGILTGLYFTNTKNVALVLLGFLSVTSSVHSFFSLITMGALVEPRLRAAAFGLRAMALHLGWLLGAVAGGLLADGPGYREVMILAAVSSLAAAMFAGAIRPVDKPSFAGVVANGNAFFDFLASSRGSTL
mmetsp:Transcript_12177/g.37124  ORF Transcript_12177/g.37124 Transcript_12177/m.37124 type:complete len:508 (-) Transcript_12177:48-1571(-)